jgi:hypothetical protein
VSREEGGKSRKRGKEAGRVLENPQKHANVHSFSKTREEKQVVRREIQTRAEERRYL